MNSRLGKVLRTSFIVFMGLNAAMNLLGGIGTSCAAFFTKKYPPMWALLDYQWLYQAFVVLSIIIGVAGIWLTIGLVKGNPKAFKRTIIMLVIGSVIAGIHMYASLALRGKAVPANVKFYLNAATLLFAFLFTLPGIRKYVDLTEPGGKTDRATAAGLAAIVAGAAFLTVAYWAGPSHTFEGVNWVYVIYWPLNIVGALLSFGGLALMTYVGVDVYRSDFRAERERPTTARSQG